MDQLLRDLLNRCMAMDDKAIAAVIKRFQRLQTLREIDAFPGWFRQIVRTCTLRIARSRREDPAGDGIEEHCENRLPEGTVKRRLYDSREQLRSMLLGYIGDTSSRRPKKQRDRELPF